VSFADEMQQRLYDFAREVVRYCCRLPDTVPGRDWSRQLQRASSGASANYRATRRAKSRDDWIAKLSNVVEELDECDHWLTLIKDAEVGPLSQNLLTDCGELRAILAKSLATARRKRRQAKEHNRRRKPPLGDGE
jgi:four helix bundle protein